MGLIQAQSLRANYISFGDLCKNSYFNFTFKSLIISKTLNGKDNSYEASSQDNSIRYVDSNSPINDKQRDFIKEILITNDDGKKWFRILTKDKRLYGSNNCLNFVNS